MSELLKMIHEQFLEYSEQLKEIAKKYRIKTKNLAKKRGVVL